MNQIYTIDLEVLCFGPTTNIRKLRKVFTELLEDENGKQSSDDLDKLFKDVPPPKVAQRISKELIDQVDALQKTGGSRVGLVMSLPDINERITEMELQELQVAKTCTCMVQWNSKNTGMQHQVIWNAGEKVSFEK
ncbi:MAG: hypothetical protein HRU15_15875 [Planctomycetes bacterium]|nr:hypothetical protein [Planctomycetota bacterium]